MRLYEFEHDNYLKQDILERCKKFFDINMGNILTRGSDNAYHKAKNEGGHFLLQNPYINKKRRAVSSSRHVDEYLYKIYNKYNIPANRSNSLFCTFKKTQASQYGLPTIIIPVGDFDYSYIDGVRDFYASSQYDRLNEMDYEHFEEFFLENIQNNSNFNDADGEMCVKADEYYVLLPDVWNILFE